MKTILTGLVLLFVALVYAESLDDGLIAYYEFEGNGNDSSGNGNHLTLAGYPNYWEGIIGNAIEFDGIDDSAVIHQALTSTLPFTWSCWILFDPNKVFVDDPPFLLLLIEQSSFWGSNPAFYVQFKTESGSCVFLFFSDLSSHEEVASQEFIIDPNSWYHLVGVAQSNGDRQIYVNGIPQGIVSNPEFGWIYSRFTLGGAFEFLPQQYMADEVRIYNRALTDLEVQALYEKRQIWGKYYVQYLNWVNTEDWLGWLWIEYAPWVWSFDYKRYLYIPEPPQDSSSAWVYMMH